MVEPLNRYRDGDFHVLLDTLAHSFNGFVERLGVAANDSNNYSPITGATIQYPAFSPPQDTKPQGQN